MKTDLKSLCRMDLSENISVYGGFPSFSIFAIIARLIITANKHALSCGDIVPISSPEQIQDAILNEGILSVVEEMEADGVLNRNNYVRDGFLILDALACQVDFLQSNTSEQVARFTAF